MARMVVGICANVDCASTITHKSVIYVGGWLKPEDEERGGTEGRRIVLDFTDHSAITRSSFCRVCDQCSGSGDVRLVVKILLRADRRPSSILHPPSPFPTHRPFNRGCRILSSFFENGHKASRLVLSWIRLRCRYLQIRCVRDQSPRSPQLSPGWRGARTNAIVRTISSAACDSNCNSLFPAEYSAASIFGNESVTSMC